MNTLTLNEMELFEAGNDFTDGLCAAVAVGSFAAGVAVATNFWNPAGWVGVAILVADGACVVNSLS